jgi:hypothetical protein
MGVGRRAGEKERENISGGIWARVFLKLKKEAGIYGEATIRTHTTLNVKRRSSAGSFVTGAGARRSTGQVGSDTPS